MYIEIVSTAKGGMRGMVRPWFRIEAIVVDVLFRYFSAFGRRMGYGACVARDASSRRYRVDDYVTRKQSKDVMSLHLLNVCNIQLP